MLVLKVNHGGFVELDTGREIIRVHVNKADDFGVSLGFDAPLSVRVVRDTVLARLYAAEPTINPLEETHVRS